MTAALARLESRPEARPSLADVVRAGRHVFLAGERIDLRELARSVGVGRTSLHRWVGTRERLISLVIASISESAIRRADEQVPASITGPARVAAVLEVFQRGVASSYPLRRFTQREPEVAARVLLAQDGDVTQRIEVAFEQLLIRSVGAARRPADPDPRTVARLMVRLADAFYYADLIGSGEPDIESAIVGIRLLLRAYFSG
jgi:AcrR family transcriptional regulator